MNVDNRSDEQKLEDRSAIKVFSCTLADYWVANAGDGDLADAWQDKPHRLVFDLVQEVERLTNRIEVLEVENAGGDPWVDRLLVALGGHTETTVALKAEIERLTAELAQRPTLTAVGVDWCDVHHDFRNEDESLCNSSGFSYDVGCRCRPLYVVDGGAS